MLRSRLLRPLVLTHMAIGVTLSLFAGNTWGQQKRPILPSDCVTVRYVQRDSLRSTILINPQGDEVAYLVKSPNLATNQNDIELHVRSLKDDRSNDRQLVSNPEMSSILWLPDGKHLTALLTRNGKLVVVEINEATGETNTLYEWEKGIVEYSISADTNTIAFAIETADSDPTKPDIKHSSKESAEGYRIPFTDPKRIGFERRQVFIVHRTPTGQWGHPYQVVIQSPLTHQFMDSIAYEEILAMSLSPNGKQLLLRYIDSSLDRPKAWRDSPFVKNAIVASGFPGTPLLVLYDVDTGQTTVPLATPFPNSIAVWSKDSRAFIIKAQSPVASEWEERDLLSKRLLANEGQHLFWVSLETGQVQRIVAADVDSERLLSWIPNGDILIRIASDQVATFTHRDRTWEQTSATRIPLDDVSAYAEIAADARNVVVDYQSLRTPPELMLYKLGSKSAEVLDKLDPQFDNLVLASAEKVEWRTNDGYPAQGLLFKPPDYRPTQTYPLVIGTMVYGGGFVCDSGDLHMPSFAPQPIADAGMFYLVRTYPKGWTLMEQQEHYPKGYPGQIGQAEFNTQVWDSAADMLASRHIVDPNKVGIIGFSITGWLTEFALVHGKTKYEAATAADNVQYSYGEYWLGHREATMRGYDAMYGGPPYGATGINWQKYAVSFNLDKVRTPLLMEEMGYGREFDRTASPPLDLSSESEVFGGLSHLGRPVELYYYPNEDHLPDHPQARLDSEQRNLDWYRFWLQGYEDPDPAKKEQYTRWKHLRELQDAEDKTDVAPNAAKPN
jgi:dipeptidyl aminopeptidase/acylaminoacyl peptidase